MPLYKVTLNNPGSSTSIIIGPLYAIISPLKDIYNKMEIDSKINALTTSISGVFSKADTAQNTADIAKSEAEEALDTANQALSRANNAGDSAGAALNYINTLKGNLQNTGFAITSQVSTITATSTLQGLKEATAQLATILADAFNGMA